MAEPVVGDLCNVKEKNPFIENPPCVNVKKKQFLVLSHSDVKG